MKRIILIVSIFIAALTSFAFADDEVMDYVTLPDSRVVELPSINAISSIYSIDDVYRILNSWNYPSGSSWIQTKDSALHLDLTTTNNRLNDIKSAINNQDFSQLHSDLITLNSSITSGNTQNHSDLTTVNLSITSGFTQNHSDLTTVNTSITSGNTQNHADLIDISNLIKNHYDTNSSSSIYVYHNGTVSNNGGWVYSNDYFYFGLPIPGSLTESGVDVALPAFGPSGASFDIELSGFVSISSGSSFNPNSVYPIDVPYSKYFTNNEIHFVFSNFPIKNGQLSIAFKVLSGSILLRGNTAFVNYINYDNPYYNQFRDFVVNSSQLGYIKHIDNDLHHQNDVIDIFKELYASDDLIAAKQAQQDVEDATLSEFTGNGSASAKVSDITSTKNAQKAVKDSLDTGASASNVSNIVGVNSGFFSFFSQSVSDSVNNPSLSRQTRDINNPDYVPDLLSQNEREYWRLINGDNR